MLRRALLPVVAPLTAFGLVLGFGGEPKAAYDKQAAAAERRAAVYTGVTQAYLNHNQHVRNVRIWRWTAAFHAHQRELFLAELARQEAERAEAARRAALPKLTRPAQTNASVSGDCYGKTPLSDTLVRNESSGNPNALGPATSSGRAWGCYQIMAGTWAGHGCAGTWGSASVDEQAACATTIYNTSGRGQWEAAG